MWSFYRGKEPRGWVLVELSLKMILKMAEVSAPWVVSYSCGFYADRRWYRIGWIYPRGAVHTTLLTSLEVSLLLYECSSRVFGSFLEMALRLYEDGDLFYQSPL